MEGFKLKITTLSSREFNQDIGLAKRASMSGPVFITDRGKVAHVFLTINEYQALTDEHENILETIAMPEAAVIEFEAPKAEQMYKPVDFS